jgi:hypothetical protein
MEVWRCGSVEVTSQVRLLPHLHTSIWLNPEAYTTDVAEWEAALQVAAKVESRTEQIQSLRQAVSPIFMGGGAT